MSKHLRTVVGLLLLGGVAALILMGRWMTSGEAPLLVQPRKPYQFRAMSTVGRVTVVVRADRGDQITAHCRSVEQAVLNVERLMSSHMEGTEVYALNNAPAGKHVSLSDPTLEVLRAARELHTETAGAFDVTIRPVIEVWKEAARTDQWPPLSKLMAARSASRWEQFELTPTGAIKSNDTASVDLGGIAKGFAIDEGVETLKARDIRGGLVELGGDLRCFGRRFDGKPWTVAVTHPFRPEETLCMLQIDPNAGGAVCTSGNYRRPIRIAGRRVNHILDPRTMNPADHSPSVTVVANTAMVADAWSTALSVLGPSGLDSLPPGEGIDAMIIMGTPDDATVHATPGFERLILGPTPRFGPPPTTKPAEPNNPIDPITRH
jgi:thiamine biosynthesis lipoprotein